MFTRYCSEADGTEFGIESTSESGECAGVDGVRFGDEQGAVRVGSPAEDDE